MPRKANSDNLEGDNSIIGIRVPVDLIKKLDKYVMQRGTNRTIEVTRGINFLVSSMECPICHSLNAGGSSVCSVCNSPLDKYKDMLTSNLDIYGVMLILIDTIQKKYDESTDRYNKLMWLIDRENPIVKDKIMFIIKKFVDKYAQITNGISENIHYRHKKIEEGVKLADDENGLPIYDSDSEVPDKLDNLCMSSYLYRYNELNHEMYCNTTTLPYQLLVELDSANRNEMGELGDILCVLDTGNDILDIIDALIESNLPQIRAEVNTNNKS